MTYYFRTHFSFPLDPVGVTLITTNLFDDGVIIYLNGIEKIRYNMPAGTVGNNTLAFDQASEGYPLSTTIAGLLPGDNLLAAEVHQASTSSSDIVFGLSLTANLPQPRLKLIRTGDVFHVQWGRTDLNLESAPGLQGPWTPIPSGFPGDASLHFDPGQQVFFRLNGPEQAAP